MTGGLILAEAEATLIFSQDSRIAGGSKEASMVTYIRRRNTSQLCFVCIMVDGGQWGGARVQLSSTRRGTLRGSGLRGAKHRLRQAGSGSRASAGQGSGVVNTLVLLVAPSTSATGRHNVVAAEFALATWFTRLELSIPTVGGIESWRVGVSVELLGDRESSHLEGFQTAFPGELRDRNAVRVGSGNGTALYITMGGGVRHGDCVSKARQGLVGDDNPATQSGRHGIRSELGSCVTVVGRVG